MALPGMKAGRMRRTSSMGDVAVRVAKAVLWAASWAMTIGWLALWVSSPTEKGRTWRKVTVGKPIASSTSKFFGRSATNYLLYTSPVIGLAILSLLYLELEKRFPAKRRCIEGNQSPLVRVYRALWTQPLVVKSPLGILSFIDLMGISVVLFTVTWLWAKLIIPQFDTINAAPPLQGQERWKMKLATASAKLGGVIPFTVTLLFLPVTRGSPILRLIDVPFEQAVRYHRWIGNLTILLVTIHGVLFAIYAGSTNQLSLLGEWKHTGISKVAGVVALLAGIAMWFTSLPYVRSRFFNTFYSMHHLYLVFFAMYAFHVDWNHIGEVMGSVFLYFIDRFLRLVQSRRHVTGVYARVLPSGVIVLKIPKHSGYKYSPLSFLFLNIPGGISRLEWHPFSTTSSPLNHSGEISLCVKPVGDWTRRLYKAVSGANSSGSVLETEKSNLSCPFSVHVEGPYGHESNYYLRYRNLVLIAGGVGVTPFLAIIRDLLERYNIQQEELPSNVRLIWCVRQTSELATLHEICPTQIFPDYAYDDHHEPKKLTLEVRAYVTGEKTARSKITESKPHEIVCDKMAYRSATFSKNTGVAAIAPNENLWVMAVIVATVFGFAFVSCLFQSYVIAPNDVPNTEKPFSTALETLLFLVSLFVGVVICGGIVVVFWVRWKEDFEGPEKLGDEVRNGHQMMQMEGGRGETLLETCDITEGLRPSFEDIFSTAEESWESSEGETGVLVSGPKSLGESVAAACRSHNFRRQQSQLHFHSVSFTL